MQKKIIMALLIGTSLAYGTSNSTTKITMTTDMVKAAIKELYEEAFGPMDDNLLAAENPCCDNCDGH